MVAKKLADRRVKGVALSLAPPPNDIIWENLTKSDAVAIRQRIIGQALLTVVATLYAVPLVALALLANLASLTQYVGFLATWSNVSPPTFAGQYFFLLLERETGNELMVRGFFFHGLGLAFAGVAPPLLSTLLQLALPMVSPCLPHLRRNSSH